MYTEKGSFGISISHLWTDYWIDFVAWPMISFCSDEPGVTAHICFRSYKTGRSLPPVYSYPKGITDMCIYLNIKYTRHVFDCLCESGTYRHVKLISFKSAKDPIMTFS